MLKSTLTYLAVGLSGLVTASEDSPYTSTKTVITYDYQKIAKDYVDLWGGDLSLVDQLVHPNISLVADRLPKSLGGGAPIAISERDAYKAFIEKSRKGWEKYEFDIQHAIGQGDMMVVRWTMHGKIGKGFPFPTTLKEGDSVSYNGTDFINLDGCTGTILEVQMAQDFITFFHGLGIKEITI